MKIIKYVIIAVLLVNISCDNNKTYTEKEMEVEIDSVSYAIGVDMGLKLRQNLPELDNDLFVEGFYNGMDSSNLKIEVAELGPIMNAFIQKKRAEEMKKMEEERTKKAEQEFGEIKKEGVKFLEENKTKEGVVTTESGLQYIVLKEGTGKSPTANDVVVVNYHGTTINGEVFDTTQGKDKPAQFSVNRVIKGWTEGLQLMKEGAKYKFFIPQELAYGVNAPRGGTGVVKPFMPLIFEVELIEVK